MRWQFKIPERFWRNETEQKRYYGRLNHILSLATALTTTARPRRVVISSFGFGNHAPTEQESREIVRRIACLIPITTVMLYQPYRGNVDRNNFIGPFLWRMLAPQPSRRRHLGLQHVSAIPMNLYEPAYATAFYSAVAFSHTLRSFAFHATRLYGSAAWLSFALFNKAASHNIKRVRLGIGNQANVGNYPEIAHSAADFIKALRPVVEHPNPVAYMYTLHEGGGIAKRLVYAPATAVRVRADAPIHVHDHLQAAKTVYHGKQEAVCHVADCDTTSEYVHLLIPGVGFGRIHRNDVLSEAPADLRTTHSVRSLSLTFDFKDVRQFAAVLKLIGAPLTSLELVAARHQRGKLARLADIFAAHMTPSVKSLYVGPAGSPCNASTRAMAIALLTTRGLERLVLHCPSTNEQEKQELAALTSRYHNERFPTIPRRSKLAFLSVVATNERLFLSREIAALVLELAAVQHRCCGLLS